MDHEEGIITYICIMKSCSHVISLVDYLKSTQISIITLVNVHYSTLYNIKFHGVYMWPSLLSKTYIDHHII
jgi:hypothetical protein